MKVVKALAVPSLFLTGASRGADEEGCVQDRIRIWGYGDLCVDIY